MGYRPQRANVADYRPRWGEFVRNEQHYISAWEYRWNLVWRQPYPFSAHIHVFCGALLLAPDPERLVMFGR